MRVALLVLVLAGCGGGSEPLCGGKQAATACAMVTGTWSGDWEITEGPATGFGDSYSFAIVGDGCTIDGTLAVGPETGDVKGQMCDGVNGELLFEASIGHGRASVVFGASQLTGTFAVTVGVNDLGLKPGDYRGRLDGAKRP